MTACVFLGPSLPVASARELLPEGTFLPPVQQGDLYAAVQRHAPSIIGIIDGYFQQRPSVWHKEILWAMSQGIHVYGAASMGALRAAELQAFGMIGIGAIFEAFHSGALPPFEGLVDDDEVAVTHGPPETGFMAVSEALVNIRHTLAAALEQHVIDEKTHIALIEQARLIHFADRSHTRLLSQARERGLCNESLERLTSWLPNGRIDQKRNDAVLLLKRVAKLTQQTSAPFRAQFNFEETEIWRDAVADMQSLRSETHGPDTLQLAIIDELRLDETNYLMIKQAALLHCTLASVEKKSGSSGQVADQTLLEQSRRKIADDYRRANTLLDRDSVDSWLTKNDMEVVEFDDMIGHEYRFRSALNVPDTPAIVDALIARLRLTGDYPALARRAREKLKVLDSMQAKTLPAAQVLRWYFVLTLSLDIPDNIESHARSLGLYDEEQLITLLRREHQFLSQKSIDKDTFSGDGL